MTTRPAPLLNVNLRWFLTGMVLANIAGQMVYSLLSLYLVELGASVSQVGLVFSVASLVPMILQILGGWFSDTVGRLRAIALGSSIALVGYLMFFVSPSWQWVMVGLCVEYVSNSFVGPSFSAYIAEQSPEGQRGRVYGLSSSIYMVVSVIGPALAGLLAYRVSFKAMFLVSFILYGLAVVVRVWMATSERFTPARQTERPSLGGLKTSLAAMAALLVAGGIFTWIWITDAVGDTAFNMIYNLYPIYLSEIGGLNLEQIGILNAGWGAATIVASYASGWVIDRHSERLAAAGGFLIEAVGMALLLTVAHSFPTYLAAMVIFGFGAGSLMPAFQSLIARVVPEERRGVAFGLYGTSLGILSLPMPWIGSLLWERFGPPTPFWFTVAACLGSILLAWTKFRVKKEPTVDSPPA